MLDDILEIFERDKRRSPNASGGLRARLARAIGGHDHDRTRHHQDDHRGSYDEDRRHHHEDDDRPYEKRRRRREFELFDDD